MIDTKKELGQHWLHDPEILRQIVNSAELSEDDTVLEIGPGLGSLTDELMNKKVNITALEYDEDLISKLQKKYKNCDSVAIIQGDIRKFNFTTISNPYKIVANIPYYLTSNLIRLISETSNPPLAAVLLVQKEVAERICAKPGDMSILSVTAQFYFECELDIIVTAAKFTPPPKVDSQVVALKRRSQKPFKVDEKEFFRLVKAGFSEKRKTLRNSLSGGLRLEKIVAEKLLAEACIDNGLRAQALSIKDWYALYLVYEKYTPKNT